MDWAPPTSQRITWFNERDQEGNLELAPPFQRKPVWTYRNKAYLIDTIIRGLPVSEIYLQFKTDKSGKTKYVVVDGQQRIRAITEFLRNKFPINEEDNSEHGGKYFKGLPDELKKEIWDYPLVVRELKTENDTEIRDIFRRLNRYVVPLNRQELRNATYIGHFVQLMNHLAEDDFWSDNKIVSPSDIRRMIDAEFISELFIGMMQGAQKRDQDSIDRFYKLYDENFDDKEEQRKRFERTLRILQEVLDDLRPTRWHHKGDFYALFLALNNLIDEYVVPAERYAEISETLVNFSNKIDIGFKKGDIKTGKTFIKEFYETLIEHTTEKEQRLKRINAVRQLLIPFLIAKDPKRPFNEEERRIAWALSKSKKCAICHKQVEWNEYQLDHIKPYSKGGKTELRNSQITHKSCNISKSNKALGKKRIG